MSRFLKHLLLTAIISCIAAAGESTQLPEYQLKATFVAALLEYVQWPTDGGPLGKDQPFVIGVLGRSPFGTSLDESIRDRTIKGRPVRVKYSLRIQDLLDCHLLFICESEADRLPYVLGHLNGKSTLTVGDTPGYILNGTMVNLYLEQKKLRLEINLQAVRSARLQINSHVLKIAKIVQ